MDRVYNSGGRRGWMGTGLGGGMVNAQTFTCVPESVARTRASPQPPVPFSTVTAASPSTPRTGRERVLERRGRVAVCWGYRGTGRRGDVPRSFCRPPPARRLLFSYSDEPVHFKYTRGRAIISRNTPLPFADRPRARVFSSERSDRSSNLDILIRG